jgi:DDE domain
MSSRSTVASSCVITGCVMTPGDPDLGGDLGCGDRVVAENVGNDGCWHFHNVLANGGRAGAAGGNTEFAEVVGEAFGVHRLFCAAVGEQPAGVGVPCHVLDKYANNPIESDHSRLKSRLRPMRGLKRLRCARVITTGHAFIQNHRITTLRAPNSVGLT